MDLQNEARASSSKRKLDEPDSEDGDDEDDDEMSVDVDLEAEDDDDDDVDMDESLVPMAQSGGISELRDKLHARMAQLRRGGRAPSGRDELLEERRRQRGAMRDRRRQATKEKIKREEESKTKRKPDIGKDEKKKQGNITKVRTRSTIIKLLPTNLLLRPNYSYPMPNCHHLENTPR